MKPCRKCGATKRMPDGRCRSCHNNRVALRKRMVVAEAKATKRPMFEDCTPGASFLYVRDATVPAGEIHRKWVGCPGGWVMALRYSEFPNLERMV